jgi:formate/nitrite transporter FocA (FNT family)
MARTIREQQRARRADRPPTPQEAEVGNPLGQEAPEVVDAGARVGAQRLGRPAAGDAITAFIGGMSVSFGAVAMAWAAASSGGAPAPSPAHLAGALAFPVGFLVLLVGKSELFTENFFLPVTAVLERRGTVGQLAALWAVTLALNLLGGLTFALLITRPGVLDGGPARYLVALAEHSVQYPFSTAFVKAIFAGWLMTLLTWLLLAARGLGPRLAIIWAVAALIVLGQFNHAIISAAEIFIAMLLGARIGVADWLTRNLLPALLGNVVGGVLFVTLLFYVQAQLHRPAGDAAGR